MGLGLKFDDEYLNNCLTFPNFMLVIISQFLFYGDACLFYFV